MTDLTNPSPVTNTVEAENRELRRIISEFGYCAPDASLEFMALVPAEVRLARALASKVTPEESISQAYQAIIQVMDIHDIPDQAAAMKYARAVVGAMRGE